MLLLTPAAKWRDGQNGRGQFFQAAPECYAVERWVLCSVRLGFVRDGLNTLELARQSIEGSGPHRRRQETCRIRLFQPPVMRQGEKTHFKVVGLQGMNSQAQKINLTSFEIEIRIP